MNLTRKPTGVARYLRRKSAVFWQISPKKNSRVGFVYKPVRKASFAIEKTMG
jgi:hypothetical protein